MTPESTTAKQSVRRRDDNISRQCLARTCGCTGAFGVLFFAGALAGLAGADEARREPPPPRFAGLCEPAKHPKLLTGSD